MSTSSIRIPYNPYIEHSASDNVRIIDKPLSIDRAKIVGKTQAQLIELLHQTYNDYN